MTFLSQNMSNAVKNIALRVKLTMASIQMECEDS